MVSVPPASPPVAAGPWTVREDGLYLAVRVTPKARRAGVAGLAADAEGGLVLKVGVSAAPEDGKANAALVELLARTWKLPRRQVRVAQGQTDRRKVVHVAGSPDALLADLQPWTDALPRL
ncbi:DUF167 domain-containing protein [Pararhodospirillum oryzae]|uniref:UPF0235 protein ROR02_25440 n=1 Tax=Pararhodospirillum oryzae TaxID=478448 RepID=A0A512HAD3_9PROT|nr:DUF167 domain-containing protein [Pararhodospirillum oryzae]GEO82413.1 UPF0235 protein [Pararhodospirillum oryzae]